MESQIEKLLTVLMNKVVDGIPDGKGGFLERPLDTEAKRFVNDCGGELDAAVAAAAHFIFVRKPSWSESMWRSALIVVVGQVPLVGSTAAIFYNQFESVWRQLRFVALAATIYGHDAREDATQCQIILCLLDDNIRKRQGPGAMDKIYKKIGKSGVQVAATIIARQVVARGGASFLMKRVLGGLLLGVVPEAVGLLYTAFFTDTFMPNNGEKAQRAKQLKERARSHFKKDERPTLTIAWVSFLVWFIPILSINIAKVWVTFDRLLMRALTVGPVQRTLLSHPVVDSYLFGTFDGSETWSAWLIHHILMSLFVSFKAALLFGVASLIILLVNHIGRKQTWMVSTAALGVRGGLNFLSARGTSISFALAIQHLNGPSPFDGLYHAHRAFVGFYSIISRAKPELKPYNPWVVGSLLLWIGYHCIIVLYTYGVAFISALAPLLFVGEHYDLQIALSDSSEAFNNISGSAFALARLSDALNALTTIALHVLIEEIRKPDIIMSLVGPKKVVEGILYAAKSLGHVVSSPDSVLFWLDKTTPPIDVSWALLSLQYGATGLGLFWGMVTHFHWLSSFEAFLITTNVLQILPKVLWNRALPPPHESQVWHEVLESRHRLLYLIPDIDSGLRSKVYDAITFFEHYEFAVHRSQEYASSSFVKVKDWVQASFTKREKQEFERLGSNPDLLEDEHGQPLEFDVGIYYDENDTWFARIRGILSFSRNKAGERETIPVDTVVESDGLGHLQLKDGASVDADDSRDLVPQHSWKQWFHLKFTAVMPWKGRANAQTSSVEIEEVDENDGTSACANAGSIEDSKIKTSESPIVAREDSPVGPTEMTDDSPIIPQEEKNELDTAPESTQPISGKVNGPMPAEASCNDREDANGETIHQDVASEVDSHQGDEASDSKSESPIPKADSNFSNIKENTGSDVDSLPENTLPKETHSTMPPESLEQDLSKDSTDELSSSQFPAEVQQDDSYSSWRPWRWRRTQPISDAAHPQDSQDSTSRNEASLATHNEEAIEENSESADGPDLAAQTESDDEFSYVDRNEVGTTNGSSKLQCNPLSKASVDDVETFSDQTSHNVSSESEDIPNKPGESQEQQGVESKVNEDEDVSWVRRWWRGKPPVAPVSKLDHDSSNKEQVEQTEFASDSKTVKGEQDNCEKAK
eukprot:CAMPEP_0171485418 /NCGR_PEP_ID=MMETSP0958-20121227/533_1 /TAXON_ID=87120 /ORGANISM="Aurantiochytrium limacinum, Strain ATCCMYA-1381" /LENGTH=1155 /DNA_ID=CAMNT_0012018203 /DNA_START=438 /DNA_END=3905 /DNA_ORIENTATION=-